MKWMFLLSFLISFQQVLFSQELSFDELYQVLDMEPRELDTLMKHKGYRLLQRENDSLGSLVYYSNLERNDEAPTWVRSLTMMEAITGTFRSRLVKYRIYDGEEYRKLMAWLLANNFTTLETFKYTGELQSVYKSDKGNILVKQIDNKLKNGRILRSYEFELGK